MEFFLSFIFLFLFSAQLQAFVASSFGQKDPFKIPTKFVDIEKRKADKKYDLSDLTLTGVVLGDPHKALFKDPDGKTIILVEGDNIGLKNSKISKILDQEVIITQTQKDGSGKEASNDYSLKIE